MFLLYMESNLDFLVVQPTDQPTYSLNYPGFLYQYAVDFNFPVISLAREINEYQIQLSTHSRKASIWEVRVYTSNLYTLSAKTTGRNYTMISFLSSKYPVFVSKICIVRPELLSVAQQCNSNPGRLGITVPRSHTVRDTLQVGLSWTSDKLVTVIRTSHNEHNGRTTMTSVEFEPAIPAIEPLQTYDSDRTATAIGTSCTGVFVYRLYIFDFLSTQCLHHLYIHLSRFPMSLKSEFKRRQPGCSIRPLLYRKHIMQILLRGSGKQY